MDTSIRDELFEHFERLRPQSIRPPAGFLKYPYCVPGGFYQQQWDWDGFFIALHLAGRAPARPEYLKYWALNFIGAAEEDGRSSGCVRAEGPVPGHPALVLKPFIAQGVYLAARLAGDYDWVGVHYPSVVRMATWRESDRRDPETGLFFWEDAMESGADNNPVVSNDHAVATRTGACDINTFQFLEYRALAGLARLTGHTSDAVEFDKRASELGTAIRLRLWDSEMSSFWNLNLSDHTPIRRVSYSNFIPLWAGLAAYEDGHQMIRRFLWNEMHMLTPHGLRSLSRQDPDYNNVNMIVPYSNWQGPVWPIANYFYFVALRRYGFTAEAVELVERLMRIYLDDIASCGSFHENYDAETGRPLAPSADQSSNGTEGGFVGWNLLLQDMIEISEGADDLPAANPVAWCSS